MVGVETRPVTIRVVDNSGSAAEIRARSPAILARVVARVPL
jgi:hypothetical protein